MSSFKNLISNLLLRIVSMFSTLMSTCTGMYWYAVRSMFKKTTKSDSPIFNIKESILSSGIKIPPAMLKCTEDELLDICNGCGAKDSWITEFIPNIVDDVNIRPCCNKHDFLYFVGKTKEEYLTANRTLLNDLIQVCDKYVVDNDLSYKESVALHDRVKVYFEFVDRYGHHYFLNKTESRLPASQIVKIIKCVKEYREN